jgi:hypothetical protein
MRGFTSAKNAILCLTVVMLTGCGKKQDKVNATSHPKPDQTAALVSLPPRLRAAIKENFVLYHVPSGADLKGHWAQADQEGSPPFLCQGDFNGDGLTDYAIVLIGQENWRFVVFEQRPEGDFFPAYVARPYLDSELPRGAREEGLFDAPQELVVEKLAKGQVWAPEAGDEPYEVKLQTDGIILHHRKKLAYGDLDQTTLIGYAQGRFKQDNCCELLVPTDKQ